MTKRHLELQTMDRNLAMDDEDGWRGSLAFQKKRHVEKIEGSKATTQPWRMKERMKTVSVALVLCLNVGVDPPDVVKTQPCARMESWLDPMSMGPQKALESIGANLQRQYERWQPRARYKQSLDPSVDEVKKLCTSLRRNAKDERVLFHYNGHGVPKPTVNGEIWVFNKTYTQYIPLSIYDLQTWMGSPSIYVYDCSNAGIILDSFKLFCHQREEELRMSSSQRMTGAAALPSMPSTNNCIQLAACSATELLPMNPELPADLFSACLTTPIKIALRWFVLQNTHKLVPNINLELIDKIPGQLNDRRTMLGELNWIFTAITDTIAWNTLPRELFQKLFRQDLLVASLFRNFLLAERIMRSYNCTPISSPKLPPTYQHPMWQAWDLALDLCLNQLPDILNENKPFQHSLFFAEQLTAFQVWLSYGSDKRSPPEQLPIVLQVLLSQVHRFRALDLLGKFLDQGPWAVNLALSVGIFPYVLKLLQSSARELRPLLVFIWAKILAVDSSCQTDLVKDNGHKYFLSVLADQQMQAEHRTMAAFVLAMIVNNYPNGQEAALQGNLISTCLEQINDSHNNLRQWLVLCLAKVWSNFDAARWCGVRDSAHEKLYTLLSDPVPEVRASSVYALGTFICNSTERTDQANNIDHGVARTLISVINDASPLVRKEMVVAFGGMVQLFETQFIAIAMQVAEEEKKPYHHATALSALQAEERRGSSARRASDAAGMSYSPTHDASGMRRSMSSRSLKGMLSPTHSSTLSTILASSTDNLHESGAMSPMKRVASTTSVSGILTTGISNIYTQVYKALLQLAHDPSPDVASLANEVIRHLRVKSVRSSQQGTRSLMASQGSHSRNNSFSTNSQSAPNSPQTKPTVDIQRKLLEQKALHDGASSVTSGSSTLPRVSSGLPPSSRSRKSSRPTAEEEEELSLKQKSGPLVSTEFFQWSCRYLAQPVNTFTDQEDPESVSHYEQEYRCIRAATLRRQGLTALRNKTSYKVQEQVFINKNLGAPTVLRFHPFDPHLAVADKDTISIWEWEIGAKLKSFSNRNGSRGSKITCLEFINTHDTAMILTGTDQGAVRVWRDYYSEEKPYGEQLVTAWMALWDMLPLPRGAGMVLKFEQTTGNLLASGDVKVVRLWDTHRESKIQDIPTGAESCITSLDSDGRHLVCAGCADGTVRLFDRRVPTHDARVMTYREHNGWVVKARMRKGGSQLISADASGTVKLWSVSAPESISTITTSTGLTSMQVHENAPVFAVGSAQQFIGVLNYEKRAVLSTIKYHDGFMGQRIGPISCMAFHPYKMKLAAGSTDSFISVYSGNNDKIR